MVANPLKRRPATQILKDPWIKAINTQAPPHEFNHEHQDKLSEGTPLINHLDLSTPVTIPPTS